MHPVHAFHALPLPESQGSPGLGRAGKGPRLPRGPRGKAERTRVQRAGMGRRSLQFISSEASSQSTNWLQRLEFPTQVPSRQRNSPAPQAVSATAPARAISQGPPRVGPGPEPPDRALNQNPGGHSSARAGVGGKGLQPGPGPTHCCKESRQSRPHSRPPRCTTACWTHSARCCIGGRSSCSGGCLQAGAGRSRPR